MFSGFVFFYFLENYEYYRDSYLATSWQKYATIGDQKQSNPKTYTAKQNVDVGSLRKHLIACLENEQSQPFPKQYSRQRNVKIDINKNMKMIEISCRCGMPDFVDDMVGVRTESIGYGIIWDV